MSDIVRRLRSTGTSLFRPDHPASLLMWEAAAEIERLRNILNEDGLHDPELAKVGGKRVNALKASTFGERTFQPPGTKRESENSGKPARKMAQMRSAALTATYPVNNGNLPFLQRRMGKLEEICP